MVLALTMSRGCVTPLQIKNLQVQVGPLEDLDLEADLAAIIDGYDEVTGEAQEKIKFALEHGHVPDEDWKGVSRAIGIFLIFSFSHHHKSRSLRRTVRVKKALTIAHQGRRSMPMRKTVNPMLATLKRHPSPRSRRAGPKGPKPNQVKRKMEEPSLHLRRRREAAKPKPSKMKMIYHSSLRRRKL